MNYRQSTRKKRRESNNKIIIGIIIATALVISIYLLSIINIPFFSSLSDKIVYGIDSIFSSIGGVIHEGTSYFGNTKKLNKKIEQLEEQIQDMQMQLSESKKIEVENKDLKEFLKIDNDYNHFNKVYANIITRSYDNWNDTFIINKGIKDGIKKKQTVVSVSGLVGYISDVQDNTSTVTTILNNSSAVSVEISNVNALALVKGDYSLKGKSQVKLVNIPIDIELAEGETVYTSGIGELYKRGIPLGTITEVISKKNDIDRMAIVDIFANVESLSKVAVIIN